MSGECAITVENLCKTYHDGLFVRKRFEALKGVTFDVKQGEIFGLLGRNGAGKTTFIKILLGTIRRTSGEATMLGYEAGRRQGRLQVGYLPEALRIPRHLNALTALEYYGRLSNLSMTEIRDRRGELLKLVGLADRAKDNVKKYSKGMLQRLGLAQALLHRPKLLVLDEPTDGLDPQARADVRRILCELKKSGVTIFLNSHILQEVEMICDRVAVLEKGDLRYCGEVSKIGQFVQEGKPLASSQDSEVVQAQTEFTVSFELGGEEAKIRSALKGLSLDSFSVKVNGHSLVKLSVFSQAEIDKAIDGLREQKISLIEMSRERVTLEDAFLQLLENKQVNL